MYNTIYPAYVRPYSIGVNNKQISKKTEDEEKSSQSSQNAENNYEQEKPRSNTTSYFPNGEKVAIDYTKRKINIEQVLTDFKNTANAIGAPDEIKNEVSSYLTLVQNQALKDRPNQQIIQSNLKNASQILDEYITGALKKPSKVVENWVDALFLQHIEYKIPQKEEKIEEKTAENNNQPQITEENEPQNDFYIPSDTELKRLFIQAKKYAAINEEEKALQAFEKAMNYADSIGDEELCAIIHFEEGLLFDSKNEINKALESYHNAASQSKDNNIKAKAHMNMAKIYDDYVRFEPAFNHYCAAVSYSGESDNLKLQSIALSDLAQIHTERYDKPNAIMFMNLSDIVANETNDKKVCAYISSKNGKNCERINENYKAVKYYGNAAKIYYDIEDSENLAKRYEAAADIMLKYNNRAKAKKLLSKAFVAAANADDSNLKKEIADKIASL